MSRHAPEHRPTTHLDAAERPRPCGLGPRPARRALPALATATVLALAVGGCGDSDSGDSGSAEPELKVSGAYIPQPLMEDMAGGFLTVTNSGDQADRLVSVSSDLAEKVELHRTKGQRMERIKSLKVPANGELRLERGGNHLMLMDLERKPAKGDTVSVVLNFEKSGKKRVKVPVKATNHTPGGAGESEGSGHSQHSTDAERADQTQAAGRAKATDEAKATGPAKATDHSTQAVSPDAAPHGETGTLDETRQPVGAGAPVRSGTPHR